MLLGGTRARVARFASRLSIFFFSLFKFFWLWKFVLTSIPKASKAKHVKRGVKEVVKALRKGDKGVVIIAGDISPGDVISHIPVLCEDSHVPYVFVPSKEDLGSAGATKRPTSCVMVVPGGGKKGDKSKTEEYREGFDEVVKEIGSI